MKHFSFDSYTSTEDKSHALERNKGEIDMS